MPVWQSSGVTPYAALQAMSFHTDGLYRRPARRGANAFALTYAANTTNDVRSRARPALRHPHGDQRHLDADPARPRRLGARVRHRPLDQRVVRRRCPGAGFTVFGASPAENAALLSAGGELRLANGFSLLAKFDGEFGGDTTVYAGTGTVRYAW